MQGPGRADIVNAGSGETRYSECRIQGLVTSMQAGGQVYGSSYANIKIS
ncbi:unnamed protein product [Staurois parvus]|uniref:Pectinesterase n=1 Tax=Staurois parvus TaxID=386267 RepID=A0ABN9FRE9_9NEOB|nr:unnamed protein product [Staurois parvus]